MEQNQILSIMSDLNQQNLGIQEFDTRSFTTPLYNPFISSSYPTNSNDTINRGMPNQNFGTSCHMVDQTSFTNRYINPLYNVQNPTILGVQNTRMNLGFQKTNIQSKNLSMILSHHNIGAQEQYIPNINISDLNMLNPYMGNFGMDSFIPQQHIIQQNHQ